MNAPRIAAVVLAAGRSSRMGKNKLLAPFAGKPVVRHVVEAATASRASPMIVVTGHAAADVVAALAGLAVEVVENRDFAKGLSESLKCGVKHVPAACDGAVILLGDMPLVTPALVDVLIEAFDPVHGREICVPVRAGRRGNPVLWGRRLFYEMMALKGDEGARRLMTAHEDTLCEVAVADDGVLIDIDTPGDLKARKAP